MAPHSMDPRQRVARAWDGGMDAETIAATFAVSRAWVQRRRETGSLVSRRQTRFRQRSLTPAQQDRLVLFIARLGFSVNKNPARRRTTSA